MRNTKLIRVPIKFDNELKRITDKIGISKTKFLEVDGTRIFKNADQINDFINIFKKDKK